MSVFNKTYNKVVREGIPHADLSTAAHMNSKEDLLSDVFENYQDGSLMLYSLQAVPEGQERLDKNLDSDRHFLVGWYTSFQALERAVLFTNVVGEFRHNVLIVHSPERL